MNNDETSLTASEIRILTMLINKMAKYDLERRLTAAGTDLSELQFGVMHLLYHKRRTIKELSTKVMLSPATLVPVIDTLERLGLATRGQDPNDRRRTPLALTEKGKQVIAALPYIDRGDALFQSVERLGDDKSHQLLLLLRELVTAMSNDESVVANVTAEIRSLIGSPPSESESL